MTRSGHDHFVEGTMAKVGAGLQREIAALREKKMLQGKAQKEG